MRFALILGGAVATIVTLALTPSAHAEDVPILQQWEGYYMVADLDHLPERQRDNSNVGIINQEQWASLWEGLNIHGDKPAEPPEVDFETNLVIFVRNTSFVNGITITEIEQIEGELSLTLMSDLSAEPISDVVFCSMAVIPREGIRSVGNITLP